MRNTFYLAKLGLLENKCKQCFFYKITPTDIQYQSLGKNLSVLPQEFTEVAAAFDDFYARQKFCN